MKTTLLVLQSLYIIKICQCVTYTYPGQGFTKFPILKSTQFTKISFEFQTTSTTKEINILYVDDIKNGGNSGDYLRVTLNRGRLNVHWDVNNGTYVCFCISYLLVDSWLFEPALIQIIRLFELRSRSPWICLPNSGKNTLGYSNFQLFEPIFIPLGANCRLNDPQLFEFLLLGDVEWEHWFSAIKTLFSSKNQVSIFMPIHTLQSLWVFIRLYWTTKPRLLQKSPTH